MSDILTRIAAYKRQEIEAAKERTDPDQMEDRAFAVPKPRGFMAASRGTLAEGRPGSAHPLSEARPERAQSQSVARADNPHGDTKLSSATGLTQEREGETLATGHLGSNRPLSERK